MEVDSSFLALFIAEEARSPTCFFDEQHVVWLQGKHLSFLHDMRKDTIENRSLTNVEERNLWFAKCSLSYFGIASATMPTVANLTFHADCLRRCGNLDDAEAALLVLRKE